MEKENFKIMVVDDMPMMRTIILSTLKKIGYKEMEASCDGMDAYDKLREGNYNLAIVDWMMPDLDGIGLLKKMRRDEKLKDLPVLMLTAKSEKDEVIEAVKAGANDYIIKPFTLKVLEDKLDSIIRN